MHNEYLFIYIYHVLDCSDFNFAELSKQVKDCFMWLNMKRFKSSGLNSEKYAHVCVWNKNESDVMVVWCVKNELELCDNEVRLLNNFSLLEHIKLMNYSFGKIIFVALQNSIFLIPSACKHEVH